MKADYCLILAAGFGTRMGELGKRLPKPLWPLYNKPLLELQIAFAKKFGIQRIYINSHFLTDQIETFLKENHKDVVILHEEEILGSGGCVHNLASQSNINYRGTLLLLNSDQFYFFDDKSTEVLFLDKQFDVRLVTLNVDKSQKYNGLVLDDNVMKGKEPPEYFDKNYVTYSGVSLINLASLERISGKTNFFETVANYQKLKVECITPKTQEYWDFGTKDLYKQNILKLKAEEDSQLYAFCVNSGVDFQNEDLMQLDKSHQISIKIKDKFFKVE